MLTVNFNPFPELNTERLHLKRMTESDVPDFFELRSDPEIMRYIPRPLAKTHEDVLKLIQTTDEAITKNHLINWGIKFHGTEKLIGSIGYYRMKPENHRAEIGYMLRKDQQGKGIVQEAMEVAIKYGFEVMRLHSIEAVIDPRNTASEKVLLRNNFVKEAHFKEDCFWEGEYLDSAHYGLLASKGINNTE